MGIAIIVPTYADHFRFNRAFLNSVADQGCDVDIIFSASEADAGRLRSFVPAPLSDRVRFISPTIDVGRIAKGKYAFITLKKLWSVNEAFARFDYSDVIVLDSEVLAMRPVTHERLRAAVDSRTVWYNPKAYEHPLLRRIKDDSLDFARVVPSVETATDEFYKSYEWYDNLCVFNRELFRRFFGHIYGLFGDWQGIGDNCRHWSFDHIAYNCYCYAHRLLTFKSTDAAAIEAFGGYEGNKDGHRLESLTYERDVVGVVRYLKMLGAYWCPKLERRVLAGALAEVPTLTFQFHLDR